MKFTGELINSNGFFRLGDFVAEIESETECSVSLCLRRSVEKPHNLNDAEEWLYADSPDKILVDVGWLDLHYPCQGPRKAMLRVCLPSEYHNVETLTALRNELFQAFSVPVATLCALYYFQAENLFCILPGDELGRG